MAKRPAKSQTADSPDRPAVPDDSYLAKAFETFTRTTEKLRKAYEVLQAKYEKVNEELEQRNVELQDSLSEIDRMRNYLNNILESMSSGLLVVDLEGRIVTFNRAAEMITGYDAEQLVGQSYRRFSPEPEPGDPLELIKGGEAQNSYQRQLKLPDDTLIPIGSTTSLVRDADGRVLGAMEIFSDLSEVKRLEEEVQRARTLAVLGQMASTVAHEIRNPLGGIEGFATLLARDFEVNDPKRKLVNRIVDGVKSLDTIVSNLLAFTRPLPTRFEEKDLIEVVESAIEYIEGESQGRGTSVRVVREYKGGPMTVRCDRDQLRQVLLNVLGNAVQVTDDSGTIRVGVREMKAGTKEHPKSGLWRKGLFRVYIADDGPGIDENSIDKIFNPFFTTKEKGTGLGLAIAQKIIEAHGGRISAANLKEGGAEFRIDLPIPIR